MTQQFSISDLASEFDITTRTLRFYEEKGLLKPLRKGQQRFYSVADRTRLKLVLRGKRLGLSLDESADIIAMYDPTTSNQRQLNTLLNSIANQRKKLQEQLTELHAMLDDLKAVEKRTRAELKKAQRAQNIIS